MARKKQIPREVVDEVIVGRGFEYAGGGGGPIRNGNLERALQESLRNVGLTRDNVVVAVYITETDGVKEYDTAVYLRRN